MCIHNMYIHTCVCTYIYIYTHTHFHMYTHTIYLRLASLVVGGPPVLYPFLLRWDVGADIVW